MVQEVSVEERPLLVGILASLAVGMVCMISGAIPVIGDSSQLSLDSVHSWTQAHPKTARLLFDALFWQWATALAFLGAYLLDWRDKRGTRFAILRTVGLFFIMVAAVAATVFIRETFLDTAWRNFEPSRMLGEGIATQSFYNVLQWVGLKVGHMTASASSSGFVAMQCMLLLGMWLHRHKRPDSRLWKKYWQPLAAVSLAMVLASRMILGGHTISDLLLGAGIGIFTFWACFSVVRGARGQVNFLRHLSAPALSYFLVGEFFCHDPRLWLILGLVGTMLLAGLLVWFTACPPFFKEKTGS